jgi:hypothetical protein
LSWRARTLSTCGAPTPQLPRLRNAFHPSILAGLSLLALGSTLQTTPLPEFCHPGLVFDTRSRTVCALDPPRVRLFTAARRATCRLWASATETIPEHTHESTKPQLQRQAAVVWVTPSLAGHCQPSLVSPGVVKLRHSTTTSEATARVAGFTPTWFGSDTSCRRLMPGVSRKRDAPCDRAVAASCESTRLSLPHLRMAGR